MSVTREAFRDGMARLAAAVNVITTDGPAGRGGFTASAVCSVTDDPPTLLVCLHLLSRQNEAVRANGVLCVNTLTADQVALSALFSTPGLPVEDRFAGAAWSTLETGAPVLDGALTAFDCRIVERLERGSHSVLFCEVLAIRADDGEPLVYFNRGYRAAERSV